MWRLCLRILMLLMQWGHISSLTCIACTSLSTRECQIDVNHYDYTPIFDVCELHNTNDNFTMECAVASWLEEHHKKTLWYIQKLCTYQLEGMENMTFCDAFANVAIRLGYKQTSCSTCKTDYCNMKRTKYGTGCHNAVVNDVHILALLLATAALKLY